MNLKSIVLMPTTAPVSSNIEIYKRRENIPPIALVEVSDRTLVAQGLMKNVSIGKAIQASNDVLYYEQQLTVIASEIKEVKMLDRGTNFKHSVKAKELLGVIKQHRSVIQEVITDILGAGRVNITFDSAGAFKVYCANIKEIATAKQALFSELRTAMRDKDKLIKP